MNGRIKHSMWPALLFAVACGGGGGGGGGGDNFIVTGLWSVAPTSTPATPSPSSAFCNQIADGVGPFPGRDFSVTQLDGTLTATEQATGGDVFNGTVNEANQSFKLVDAQPTPFNVGSGCVVTGVFNVDFFNAAGNTADPVNVAIAFVGNNVCPQQCTLVWSSTATRS